MRVTHSPDERVGLALMGVVVLVYGLLPVFTRGLVTGADPIFVAAVANLVGSAPFWLWLGAKGQLAEAVAPHSLPRLLLIAFFATTVSSLCFFLGTAQTSAANASLLIQSEPVYSIALSAIFLGEAVSARHLGATALLLAGAAAVLFQDGLQLQAGDALVALTPLWYQVGHLIAKKMMPGLKTRMVIPAMRMGVGGALLMIIALVRDPGVAQLLLDPGLMARLALFGLAVVGLEKLAWYEALARIDLGKASALLVPSVAVGVVGAWLLLDEPLSLAQLAGLMLMLAGLGWLATLQLNTAGRPRQR